MNKVCAVTEGKYLEKEAEIRRKKLHRDVFTHAGTAMSLKFEIFIIIFIFFGGGRASDWLVVITCWQL